MGNVQDVLMSSPGTHSSAGLSLRCLQCQSDPLISPAAGIVRSLLALGKLIRSDPQQPPDSAFCLTWVENGLSTSYSPAAQLAQGCLYPFNFFTICGQIY